MHTKTPEKKKEVTEVSESLYPGFLFTKREKIKNELENRAKEVLVSPPKIDKSNKYYKKVAKERKSIWEMELPKNKEKREMIEMQEKEFNEKRPKTSMKLLDSRKKRENGMKRESMAYLKPLKRMESAGNPRKDIEERLRKARSLMMKFKND